MKSTLPKWMSLEQAAEWLTDKTRDFGWVFSADLLLEIVTSLGPMGEIRNTLPIWLLCPVPGLHIEHSSSSEKIPLSSPYIPISNETIQLFCVHHVIDSALVRPGFQEGDSARLAAGIAISRDWLVVQGLDVFMFLNAYANTQKSIQSRLNDSVTQEKPSEVSPAGLLRPDAKPAGLTTPEIAGLFHNFNGWSEEDWSRRLADGRIKWLASARISKGVRGGASATWNPISIAMNLHDKGTALAALDAVFKKTNAKRWRDKWDQDTDAFRG